MHESELVNCEKTPVGERERGLEHTVCERERERENTHTNTHIDMDFIWNRFVDTKGGHGESTGVRETARERERDAPPDTGEETVERLRISVEVASVKQIADMM